MGDIDAITTKGLLIVTVMYHGLPFAVAHRNISAAPLDPDHTRVRCAEVVVPIRSFKGFLFNHNVSCFVFARDRFGNRPDAPIDT